MPFDGTHYQHQTLAHDLGRARLRFARNKIADGQWCQKRVSDETGNRCLVGWTRCQEVNIDIIHIHAIQQLWIALPKSARRRSRYHSRTDDVARYNDTHTRNTVIKLLDRAIVESEAHSQGREEGRNVG